MTRRPWLNGLLRRNNFQEGNKKTLRVRKLTSGNPDELLCWQNSHRTLLVPETVFIQLNINLDLDYHDPYPVNFRSSLNCVITLLCNVSPVCKAHSPLHRPTTIPHSDNALATRNHANVSMRWSTRDGFDHDQRGHGLERGRQGFR